MDGDEFTRRYQLLKKLVEGTVTTYLARAASGDRVMTHFLQGRHAAQLLDRLDALPEERRRHLRTVTDLDGTPVVVTDYLDDFDSFRSWTSSSGSETPETGDSEPAESDGPGEFTHLFEAPGSDAGAAPDGVEGSDAGAGDTPQAPDSASKPSDPPSEPSEAGSDEPGEFTRLFQAPTAGEGSGEEGSAPPDEGSVAPEEESAPPDARDPAPDPTEPTHDARESEPGQRERPRAADAEAPGESAPSGDRPFLFRSPVQGEASDETAEPAASGGEEPEADEEAPGGDEPGELTRMLRAESESDPATGDSDRASDDRASDEPGEFTRRFGSAGDGDDLEPPASGEATGGGSATDAFRSPDLPSAGESTGEADADDPGAATGDAAEEGDREPGQFTRMFGSRSGPAGGSPDGGSLDVGGGTPGSTSDDDPDDYLRRLGAEPPPSSSGPGRAPAEGAGGAARPPSEGPPPLEGGVDGSRGEGDRSGRGPSDYTRIVRGRGAQGAGASAGSAPTPAAPPSQQREDETRHWPYLAALGGIFLIAIVLLVVFLVTGGGDEATPAEDAGEGEPAAEEVVSPPGEEG